MMDRIVEEVKCEDFHFHFSARVEVDCTVQSGRATMEILSRMEFEGSRTTTSNVLGCRLSSPNQLS